MVDNGIDKTLAEFGEAETQIRGMLADALSRKLIGRSWPTYGDEADADAFNENLDQAAKIHGYVVLK
ncbi:hypothetical protein [Pseudomonas sp. PDM25]|uniref:hypothetical protein n=1 Tax=Pseudomonas sp. PDM25 TaxID=2854772 RepID=UPI002110B2D2|nr:hypothetical protein [Pseudomonas sp. PDM25]